MWNHVLLFCDCFPSVNSDAPSHSLDLGMESLVDLIAKHARN